MAEPSSTPAGATTVASDFNNPSTDFPAPTTSPEVGKRSAAEAFEGDSVEDLKDAETTLDDVLVSPLTKKSRLLDADLPDVDDDEQFPQQEEDMDAELSLGLENGDNMQDMEAEGLGMEDIQHTAIENLEMEEQQKDMEELAPPDEEESEPPTSQNNEIDIVDVEEEEEDSHAGEYREDSGPDEEEEEEDEDEDEHETARAVARAQNQREARQLLMQLDNSARSKLCLTALEKYGEELFYGHEDARDAILVDACAQESVLSLMRDAIRVRDLYLRGSSAAAPVELDDDDDDDDDETGGYEDEEEEADDEEEKPPPSGEDDDDEIVVISEEDEEEDPDSEAPAGDDAQDERDEPEDGPGDVNPGQAADGASSDADDSNQESKEDDAQADVEAADDSVRAADAAT